MEAPVQAQAQAQNHPQYRTAPKVTMSGICHICKLHRPKVELVLRHWVCAECKSVIRRPDIEVSNGEQLDCCGPLAAA